MRKAWHREDIVSSLSERGWSGPSEAPPDDYFVGEKLVFSREGVELVVSFVADVGTGYTGPRSLEEAVAQPAGGEEARLWLHRRRDGKWRRDLAQWSGRLSQE